MPPGAALNQIPLTNKYLFRELAQKGPKYGLGFSRILNKLHPEQLEALHAGGFLSHRSLEPAPKIDFVQRQASFPNILSNAGNQNQAMHIHTNHPGMVDNHNSPMDAQESISQVTAGLGHSTSSDQLKILPHPQFLQLTERKISLKLPSPKTSGGVGLPGSHIMSKTAS